MSDRQNVLQDIRDYFAECERNAANGSVAKNRFRVYQDTVIGLVREEEPVTPEWRQGKPSCGGCGLRIASGQRFCPHCGRAVKWDG